MKRYLICMAWLCLLVSTTYAQSDYTTYQLTFRQGNKIVTIQPDFATAGTSSNARTDKNDQSQFFIFKRQGDGTLLIASAAAPDKFLKRNGNTLSFAAYNDGQKTNYLWQLKATQSNTTPGINTSDGAKLLALLVDPANTSQVLTLQSNGSLTMSTVNYSLSDDPYRIYIGKKLVPGKF
ncbi:hypothetical protein [uncultured Microscilla sp.]|uniref:hypothetical protein n=1 Tax=uncultured Microscilla sp. TaxID=432653 RepID=UPI002628666F|nr:hypothetical protein [uncultured Microscilla sp.]